MWLIKILIASILLFSAPVLAAEDYSHLKNFDYYILVDADSKEILLSENADLRMAPSSMTKMMTAYVVFDQITKGKIGFDNQCLIGKDAWRKYGSTMFLNYGDIVTIDELVKGLLVSSGNDAAIALAESSAGGIDIFIDLMNLKAKELGLTGSHFKNPHGLNEDGHYMTLRDLATLTMRLYQDFPQYARYLGISEFTYHNIRQKNRHPLMRENYEGVIGGKTGHTTQGGYGVAAIAERNGRKLIAVINKSKSSKERSEIITELLDYGFNNYKKLTFFSKNQKVTSLDVWLGKKTSVDVITNQQIALNLPIEKALNSLQVSVEYEGPLYTPLNQGDKVAELVIKVGNYQTFKYPLFAKESVKKASYFTRVQRILRYKLKNFFNNFAK